MGNSIAGDLVLTCSRNPSLDEDPLEQKAKAEADQEEDHSVEELADGKLEEHIPNFPLGDFGDMIAKPPMSHDPEVESRLAIENNQGGQY